jgi:hypothetical protein
VAFLAMRKLIKLARQASAMPLLGLEPAVGIPRCSAREAIKNWIEYQHYIAWKDLPGHRYGKLFIGRPCKRRAEDLLKLSRHSKNGSCNLHGTCSCEEAPAYHGRV